MKSIFSPIRFSACLLLAFSILLTGCASTLPNKITRVEHYPKCYEPIQALRDTEYMVAKYAAGGALLGALGGVGTAILIKGRRTSAKDALIGGAVGALAGGTAGYFIGKSAKDKTMNQRLAQHISDIDDYSEKMDKSIFAARAAQDCYSASFDRAVADYKAQRISKEDFDRRYVEISDGMTEAGMFLKASIDSGRKIQDDYHAVMLSEAEELNLDKEDVDTLKASNRPVAEARHKEKPVVKTAQRPKAAQTASSGSTAKAPAKKESAKVDKKKVGAVEEKVKQKEDLKQMQAMAERSESLELTLALMEDELSMHNQQLARMEEEKKKV